MTGIPGMVIISQEEYDWLCTNYVSPIGGEREQARAQLSDWGYDPDALPWQLVDAMGQEMAEALVDAGIDFMRDHGLVNLAAGEQPPSDEATGVPTG